MHGSEQSGYGLWFLVILNSAIFIIFAFSFVKPKSKTDWRSLDQPGVSVPFIMFNTTSQEVLNQAVKFAV